MKSGRPAASLETAAERSQLDSPFKASGVNMDVEDELPEYQERVLSCAGPRVYIDGNDVAFHGTCRFNPHRSGARDSSYL